MASLISKVKKKNVWHIFGDGSSTFVLTIHYGEWMSLSFFSLSSLAFSLSQPNKNKFHSSMLKTIMHIRKYWTIYLKAVQYWATCPELQPPSPETKLCYIVCFLCSVNHSLSYLCSVKRELLNTRICHFHFVPLNCTFVFYLGVQWSN